MQVKSTFVHPTKARQTALGETPKALNSIYVAATSDKLITSMIHTQVLGIANIYEPIISSPAIRMNN